MAASLEQTALYEQADLKADQFFDDVIAGLKSTQKHLQSKYFYDAAGDSIFQEIMNCEEYYLFNSELEIFSSKTAGLAKAIMAPGGPFDLIELGAGDCTKSSYLLKYLVEINTDFNYMPIDISSNIIEYLNLQLPVTIPGLQIQGLNGEYFDMLKNATGLSQNRKVVLFLGSNLGNMPVAEAEFFCRELRSHLSPGDLALLGLDLKKDPKIILDAYNDKGGVTKNFNLNLLNRINRELNADFDTTQFEHFPTYDPETGTCKSYLVSLEDQHVRINGSTTIHFAKHESIFMEISQKYTIEQTDLIAANSGFEPVCHFYDDKKWFIDTLWKVE
jgi:L-histidine N-alpha-methyltransferase